MCRKCTASFVGTVFCHNCSEPEADAHGGCDSSAESDVHGDALSAPTPTPTAKFQVDPRDDNEEWYVAPEVVDNRGSDQRDNEEQVRAILISNSITVYGMLEDIRAWMEQRETQPSHA